MNDDDFRITRRHLPHWTLKDSTYFVTFRLKGGELTKEEQCVVLEHIKSGNEKFYSLYAVIVMPNHVHVIFQPNEGITLSRIMHGMKGVTARKINLIRNSTGAIWQDESFDRIIRNEKEFFEKVNYMFNNPIKKELTEDTNNYHGWHYNEITM